jgi:hypothetical protein
MSGLTFEQGHVPFRQVE